MNTPHAKRSPWLAPVRSLRSRAVAPSKSPSPKASCMPIWTFAPRSVITMAHERGLDVQFELGKKHDGAFGEDVVAELIVQGQSWLDAGAEEIVVEARESAQGVGLFDDDGVLNRSFA